MNAENKIVGIGYNGMPNGCSDDLLPWRRTAENRLDTKYPYGRVGVLPFCLAVWSGAGAPEVSVPGFCSMARKLYLPIIYSVIQKTQKRGFLA